MSKHNFPIYPTNERLFVQPMAVKEKVGGIYIPDNAKEKPLFGKVVAISTLKDPMIVENCVVLYGKYSGTEIKVLNETYLIMREDEILGVVIDGKLADSMLTTD